MDSVAAENFYDHESNGDREARLPGEEVGQGASESAQATSEPVSDDLATDRRDPPTKPKKNNNFLYAGVGMAALLVMTGGYILSRPKIVSMPAPPTQARIIHQSGMAPQGLIPLAPSATLANVHLKTPPASVYQKYTPQSASSELSEVEELHPSQPAGLPAIVAAPAPIGAKAELHPPQLAVKSETGPGVSNPPLQTASNGQQAPHAAATAPHPLAATSTALMPAGGPLNPPQVAVQNRPLSPVVGAVAQAGRPISALNTPPALPATAVVKTEAPLAPNGAMTLAAAQAGALSSGQQTELFQLVTELATLERTDRINEAVLSGQVQEMSGLLTAKLADFDRRISIQEAQNAVSGAMEAGSSTGITATIAAPPVMATTARVASSVSSPGSQSLGTAVVGPESVSAEAPIGAGGVAQYHVQAASPGLAMLSPIGGGAPLEVQVGDNIPGYGAVTAVVQQGDSWVVQTKSGNIE